MAQLTCNWLLPDEAGELNIVCGEEAPYEVTAKTRQITATVPLCPRHKAAHDEAFARSRTANKKSQSNG